MFIISQSRFVDYDALADIEDAEDEGVLVARVEIIGTKPMSDPVLAASIELRLAPGCPGDGDEEWGWNGWCDIALIIEGRAIGWNDALKEYDIGYEADSMWGAFNEKCTEVGDFTDPFVQAELEKVLWAIIRSGQP
jgi:hypothetical protein